MKKDKCLLAVAFLLGAFSVTANPDQGIVYLIEADFFVNGSASLEGISAIHGSTSLYQSEESDYEIMVLSKGGDELFRRYIDVSFMGEVAFIRPENLSGADPMFGFVNQTRISLRVPYFHEATKISFLKLGKPVLEIDLERDFCDRDSVCDLGESIVNCPRDCVGVTITSGPAVSTTKKPSSATLIPQTTTLPQGGGAPGYISFIALMLVLGIVGGVLYFIYRKRGLGAK